MILSRSKPALSETARKPNSLKEIPTLEEFLKNRDYTGALTLFEFNKENDDSLRSQLWVAYCTFHLGDYKKAAEIYEKLGKKEGRAPVDVSTNLGCCYFYLGMYPEAEKIAQDALDDSCKNRLLLHLAHKMGNSGKFGECQRALQKSAEDQLSLASVHYLRNNYQEAISVYKNILASNRDYLALHVYQALCLYKQEFYDTAEEVLQAYLQQYPDSATALNLKACNNFRVYDMAAVQAIMKQLLEKVSPSSFGYDLIQHNNVVFRGGEGALQIFPKLVDVIPEARLNLAIYYLMQKDVQEAHDLMKDVDPKDHQEYILKAITHAIIGQDKNSIEDIQMAEEYFRFVGSSEDQVDTIPGRQCMASSFFLSRDFEKVLLYLQTIKSYFSKEDVFNFNYAQTQVASGRFKEAEEAFNLIQKESHKSDYTFISMLAYCYIMNGKGQLAWEMYLKMDTFAKNNFCKKLMDSPESINFLQLIGNVCYKVGEFWYAAKAFDMLDKHDPTPEYWEGKRGACCGTFQNIVANKLPRELLPEVIDLLKNTRNLQSEQIIRVMKKWAKDNQIPC